MRWPDIMNFVREICTGRLTGHGHGHGIVEEIILLIVNCCTRRAQAYPTNYRLNHTPNCRKLLQILAAQMCGKRRKCGRNDAAHWTVFIYRWTFARRWTSRVCPHKMYATIQSTVAWLLCNRQRKDISPHGIRHGRRRRLHFTWIRFFHTDQTK